MASQSVGAHNVLSIVLARCYGLFSWPMLLWPIVSLVRLMSRCDDDTQITVAIIRCTFNSVTYGDLPGSLSILQKSTLQTAF